MFGLSGMLRERASLLAALTYTLISLMAAGAFFAVTVSTGDYTWVARLGGTVWVFLLSMIILMPVVTPLVKRRLGE